MTNIVEKPRGEGKTERMLKVVLDTALTGKNVLVLSATASQREQLLERLVDKLKLLDQTFIREGQTLLLAPLGQIRVDIAGRADVSIEPRLRWYDDVAIDHFALERIVARLESRIKEWSAIPTYEESE